MLTVGSRKELNQNYWDNTPEPSREEVRAWDQWDRWIGEIRALGYSTRVIALNSIHAQSTRTPAAPQSRDRCYVAYWDRGLGREPDWDKWLRPLAHCETCDEWVQALQVWKRPGADMGRYRQQYLYRCPHVSCRNALLEPPALPAAAAIDWGLPGARIGDRAKPLAEKTLERIRVGLRRYAGATPLIVPAGGTWRSEATPVTAVMSTRTTRENDGLVIPPLMVPTEGRDGKEATLAAMPLRTQTTRNETGVAFLPFVAELRGGSSDARPVTDALATVTASGNHHGLVTPGAGMTAELRDTLLLPYYGTGTARPVSEPIGTLSTRDRYGLVASITEHSLDDVRFRMLEPHEIGAAMAFTSGYTVLGNKRQKVRQYGNAVTPPVAEILISALVEAITGEGLDRWDATAGQWSLAA
jgi:DNA (cytosine-5)-methyltransferase 1